jgi:CubicO group peptidase (beta-lactamase class C family)
MTQNHLTEQQQYLAAINYQESSWDPQTLSPDIGFGLGFAIIEGVSDPGDTASKGSLFWGGAAATYFWIDPAEDIVVVAMTQHMGVDGVWSIEGELAELVYGALVERNKLN